MPHAAHSRIRIPTPFELRLAVWGHGWVDLVPHHWCEETKTFTTVITTGRGPADLRIRASTTALALRIESHHELPAGDRATLRATVRRMLRLDENLTPFWNLCRRMPRLAWVARRGGGRMRRSASLFEDLLKLLFTTNCRKFRLPQDELAGLTIEDITQQTIPHDFQRNQRIHKAFRITRE